MNRRTLILTGPKLGSRSVWMVVRNAVARRLFSTLDDLFYGKRPRPKEPPAWASFRK